MSCLSVGRLHSVCKNNDLYFCFFFKRKINRLRRLQFIVLTSMNNNISNYMIKYDDDNNINKNNIIMVMIM